MSSNDVNYIKLVVGVNIYIIDTDSAGVFQVARTNYIIGVIIFTGVGHLFGYLRHDIALRAAFFLHGTMQRCHSNSPSG